MVELVWNQLNIDSGRDGRFSGIIFVVGFVKLKLRFGWKCDICGINFSGIFFIGIAYSCLISSISVSTEGIGLHRGTGTGGIGLLRGTGTGDNGFS